MCVQEALDSCWEHSRKATAGEEDFTPFLPQHPFPLLCLQCWWTSFLSLEATSSTSAQYSYSWVIPAHICNRRRCQNFFTQQIQMSHDQQEALIPILKTAIAADNNFVIIIATSALQMHNYHGWGKFWPCKLCFFYILSFSRANVWPLWQKLVFFFQFHSVVILK